jgi:hypothetical protein
MLLNVDRVLTGHELKLENIVRLIYDDERQTKMESQLGVMSLLLYDYSARNSGFREGEIAGGITRECQVSLLRL